MNCRLPLLLVLTGSLLFGASCNNGENQKATTGPIVLGDPATIVTETDPKYLSDNFPEIKPAAPATTTAAAMPVAATDSAVKPEVPAPVSEQPKPDTPSRQAPKGQGLQVAFKEVTVFIPGIATRTYGNQHPERSNGATFELTGGDLNGKQLQISGGTVQKVTMRYQTIVVVKNELGTLPLANLGATSGTETLKGGGSNWNITGLAPNQLQHVNASPATIRNAVTRAVRNDRAQRRNEQKWLNSIKNVRSVTQPPLSVKLKNVVWTITGKDARGKSFTKQLRIDIPA